VTQGKYVYLGFAKKTSYTDSGLTTGTEYKYKVRGYWTIGGTKYFGAYSEVLTTATKPAKVKNLTLLTESSTSITLTWSKSVSVTGYQIYRLNSTTGKYEKVASVKGSTTLSFTDTGLSTGTEYTYKVRAYKASDGTNYYGSFCTAAKAVTKPAKVKELKLTTKSSAVTLSWKKVSRVTGYQIYRLNKKTGEYEKLTTVKSANTCTYKNTKLTKGNSYTYKVRAYKTYNGKNYYGSFSTAVKITVK
jgi:fibronectin type 3 domain-containing protein